LFHLGIGPGLEDDHLVVASKAVHPLQGFGARFLEARGRFIGGLHRSRGIQDDTRNWAGLAFVAK